MDDRLICMIPTAQTTRNSRYTVIDKEDGKIKIQLDNGKYGWINRNKFITSEEVKG